MRSPLEVVLFQVRLPRAYTPLQDAIQSGAVQRELSKSFPYAELQDVFDIMIQPGRDPQPMSSGSKALSMADESQKWTLNITRDAVALTSTEYANRADLLNRASVIFSALQNAAAPPRVARVGIRYLNRITDMTLAESVIDGLAEELKPLQQFSFSKLQSMQHSMADMLFSWSGSMNKLQARCGMLPAGQVVDGSLSPFHDGPSWILDIDSFDEAPRDFAADTLVETLAGLAERAYRYFRWVCTPDALSNFEVVNG